MSKKAEDSVLVMNDVCRSGGKYSNWFSWIALPYTKFNGTETIDGRVCNWWTLVAKGTNIAACTTDDSVIRFMAMKGNKPVNMTFSNVQQTPSLKQTPPSYCSDPPRVCASGKWEDVSMYRLHNVHDVKLSNRNFGSPTGDLLYIW